MPNTKPENINLPKDFETYIKEEKVLWKGKPQWSFSIAILETNSGVDIINMVRSPAGFLIGVFLFIVYFFGVKSGNWLLPALSGLLLLLSPDIYREYRRRNTFYALTEKGIYFQLWEWGKYFHFLDFKDVKNISQIKYKNGTGVLFIHLNKPSNFKTYDIRATKKRFHPTVESVKDVEKLKNKVVELLLAKDRK